MMNVPEREPRAIEPGIELDRRLEVSDLRRRRRRHESLDVVFEHRQRGPSGRHARRRRAGEAPADPLERRKEILERAGFDEFVLHLPGIEPYAPRAHGEHSARQPERANDDVRCADDLSEADDSGMAQGGDGRHLQALEGIEALFARVCVPAERVQLISQQNGRRFAHPVDARFSCGIFERNNEHAFGAPCRRLANDEHGTRNQRTRNRNRNWNRIVVYFCSGGTFTAMTQAASPMPLHACTRTSPLTPTSAKRCESAAE